MKNKCLNCGVEADYAHRVAGEFCSDSCAIIKLKEYREKYWELRKRYETKNHRT